jgi:hypothetical protein
MLFPIWAIGSHNHTPASLSGRMEVEVHQVRIWQTKVEIRFRKGTIAHHHDIYISGAF